MYGKLEKHKGCVNTVSFNEGGDILVSGSDDLQVILWNWEGMQEKLSFDSGHDNNVFQAKIMPYSDDRSIVTSAADGQVTLSFFFFFHEVVGHEWNDIKLHNPCFIISMLY